MSYQYDLYISDLVIRIETPRELKLSGCFRPFLIDKGTVREPDFRIEIQFGTKNVNFKERQADLPEDICLLDDRLIQRYKLLKGGYLYRIEYPCRRDFFQIAVPDFFAAQFCNEVNMLLHLAFERLILPFNRVIIHASAVIKDGKAYVFSAPSGGGKSTHAKLWEKYLGAEILNGDKVILAVDSKGCIAYGGPIAGSSGIYKQKGAPVAAIVFLEKGDENDAVTEKKRKGYLKLYSELIKSTWDENFNCRLLELAESVAWTVPFITFRCTAEPEAVEYIKNYLERNLYED